MKSDELFSLFEAVLPNFDNDIELLKEVCAIYMKGQPALSEGLFQAMRAGDQELVEERAHKLKGAISNFGDLGPFMDLDRIEVAARRRTFVVDVQEIEKLKQDLDRLHTILNRLLSGARSAA